MKKTVLIISLILIVSIIGIVTVQATLDPQLKFKKKPPVDETYVVKTDIAKEKTVSLKDGSTIKLNYVETLEGENAQLHYYEDLNGVKYEFDQNGKKVGISNFLYTTDPDKIIDSKDKIIQITEAYMQNYFGDDFEGYKLIEINEGGYVGGYVDGYIYQYNAIFSRHYGENNFVRGEGWLVTVSSDGTIMGCTKTGAGVDDGFKPESLNGITRQKVEAFVDAKVKADYGDLLENYKIDFIVVCEADGDFALRIPVSVSFKAGENSLSELAGYYYEIP